MSTPVKLYVYDLSNGLARQMSMQLTGRQIDGIWHTSVVVFGKEIFYGQGISITHPGQSHHGRPLQILDVGQTALDEQTFTEYLDEIRQHYTADKYHLLDFNCNSFTNDCVGFLTGGSIPLWIKDLPTDFLSTPFGAALRPTIDAMYRRPTPGAPVTSPSPHNPQLPTSLLQSVASRAAGPSSAGSNGYLPTPAATPLPETASVAAPLQVCTNPQSFNTLLHTHRAVTAFFTSQTCPPCRMVQPAFEGLAREKASAGVGFAKVDIGVGMGREVGHTWGVRVTPTFMFFLNGKKIHEVKGADAVELRTQVDLLIYQAFPPHSHVKLDLPAIRALSLNAILFAQVPALETAQAKLESFIDAATVPALDPKQKAKAKQTLASPIMPFLKTRFASKTPVGTPAARVHGVCVEWSKLTINLVDALPVVELFPLVDMWRLALLDETVSSWCATAASASSPASPVRALLEKAVSTIEAGAAAAPRNFLLTVLRMLANGFSHVTLARTLLDSRPTSGSSSPRQSLTNLLVATLLHADAAVRTAAASLAFNVAAHCQKPLIEAQRSGRKGENARGDDGEGDWEVEMTSAVVEALGRETQSEDVVHRLTASLAFFLHLSPYYESQLKPLLEVLQAREVISAKLRGGTNGCGQQGVIKKDVRKLIEEVAQTLC